MSNCPDDIKTLLSKLVDGEITPDERARADSHTAECAPCRELLDLFRKNETLVAGALESEAFGNVVIESVVRSIRHEGPPVADPVEEGPIEWLRARPWLPLSAAALFLVGLTVLVVRQSSELGELRAAWETSQADRTDFLRATMAQQEQTAKLLKDLQVNASTNGVRGFWEDKALSVKAGFDAREFEYFEVWRRADGDAEFVKINTARGEERLRSPEYRDHGVKPGKSYWYKFRAVRANGGAVESAPIQMHARFADGLSPEQSVKIHCFDLAVTKDLGVFLLERVVDGRALVEKFVVKTGEPVGGPVEVAGVGRVNFTTGLTLGRIEEAHETLSLTYAEPVLDDQGRQIIETLKNGQAVPVTRQHEVPLSIRPNLRASFRTDAGAATEMFKGSWMRVQAK